MIYLIEIFRNAKVIMRNVVGFFILVFLSNSVFSQSAERAREMLNKSEKDATLRRRLEPRISDKYYLGRFLIYDCKAQHFALDGGSSAYYAHSEYGRYRFARVIAAQYRVLDHKNLAHGFDMLARSIYRPLRPMQCLEFVPTR